jgi:hypothetical protein
MKIVEITYSDQFNLCLKMLKKFQQLLHHQFSISPMSIIPKYDQYLVHNWTGKKSAAHVTGVDPS